MRDIVLLRHTGAAKHPRHRVSAFVCIESSKSLPVQHYGCLYNVCIQSLQATQALERGGSLA